MCHTGREQSMKPMIGKSIDQLMTIDALLVNWHRLASANWWPIDNHTKVVATHRLSSIGIKKSRYHPHCTYTHSQYAQMFEIWIRSPGCLYAVAWFQKSATETHFKTVFWRNTSQKHTFSHSCSSMSFILLMSDWYELLGILYFIFHYFLFFQQVLSTRRVRWNHYYLIYPCKVSENNEV